MIVCLVGRKDAGKSQVARRLATHHGFTVISPIDPGKRLAEELGFSKESVWGPSSARELPHPYLKRADGSPLILRGFLDRLSAAIRAECPTIMLEAALRHEGDVVNESVRLVVELEAYKARGARLIKRRGGIATDDEYDQLSDVPDAFFDAVLPQFGTLEQLHFAVDTLISGWKSEAGR